MSERKHVSPTEVIFRGFPDAMRNAARAVVRIRSIENRAGDTPNGQMVRHILARVAERITDELALQTAHRQEQLRRRRVRRNEAANPANNTGSDTDDLFGAMFGDGPAVADVADPETITEPTIRPQNINFVLVDSDALTRTRLFPRTFYCGSCGHFVAIQPDQPPTSLRCPCCRQSTLRQEPIVFGCARCAAIRELVP